MDLKTNTWGLYSVNSSTFNNKVDSDAKISKTVRNILYKAFVITNLVLNILGYLPIISFMSGLVRMGIGGLFAAVALIRGSEWGFYDEALTTAACQIARGALEAIIPGGTFVNLVLDVVATPITYYQGKSFAKKHEGHCHGNPSFLAC